MLLLKSLLVVCLALGCGHLATPADAKSLDTLEPTRHLLAKKASTPPSKSKAPAKKAPPPAKKATKGKQASACA